MITDKKIVAMEELPGRRGIQDSGLGEDDGFQHVLYFLHLPYSQRGSNQLRGKFRRFPIFNLHRTRNLPESEPQEEERSVDGPVLENC